MGKQCRERCSYPCPTHPVMPFCWTWWTLGLRPFPRPAPAPPFKHLRSRPGVCVHAGGTTTCAPPSTRTSGRWRRTHASSSWFAPLSRRLLPTPPVLSSPPQPRRPYLTPSRSLPSHWRRLKCRPQQYTYPHHNPARPPPSTPNPCLLPGVPDRHQVGQDRPDAPRPHGQRDQEPLELEDAPHPAAAAQG